MSPVTVYNGNIVCRYCVGNKDFSTTLSNNHILGPLWPLSH